MLARHLKAHERQRVQDISDDKICISHTRLTLDFSYIKPLRPPTGTCIETR
jgi:hypothetical protein